MKLVWRKQARINLERAADFLAEYSEQAESSFRKRVETAVEQILKYPDSGKVSNKVPDVLSIKIKPHWRLYWEYDVAENTIYFLEFFDQRQDPSKNRF